MDELADENRKFIPLNNTKIQREMDRQRNLIQVKQRERQNDSLECIFYDGKVDKKTSIRQGSTSNVKKSVEHYTIVEEPGSELIQFLVVETPLKTEKVFLTIKIEKYN